VDLPGIRFEVDKEMSADSPRRISRLTARLWLPPAARNVPEGVLEKAANNCPVHVSLAPTVEKIIELVWE
jgi:putative redox protein